jgi:hypothetical protein
VELVAYIANQEMLKQILVLNPKEIGNLGELTTKGALVLNGSLDWKI